MLILLILDSVAVSQSNKNVVSGLAASLIYKYNMSSLHLTIHY